MKRFLINATAIALGLAIWGLAKADDRNGYCSDDRRLDCHRGEFLRFDPWRFDFDRDEIRRLDPWRFEFDWDDYRRLEPWRFDFDRDDLRYFDDDINHFCVHSATASTSIGKHHAN